MNRRDRKSWAGPVAMVLLLLGLAGQVLAEEAVKLGAKEIVSSADALRGGDAASRQGMQRLVQTVQAQRLGDVTSARGLTVEDWQKVVSALRGDLSKDARALWAARLREAFLPEKGAGTPSSPKELGGVFELGKALGLSVAERKAWADRLYGVFEADPASFTYQDCDSLRGCLNVLGSEKQEAVYPVWVEKTEVWKAIDPNELRLLASALSEQGERGKAGLARIREHVEGVWLKDSKRVRAIAADTWRGLGQALAVTDAENAQWAGQLLKAYDADLKTMRSQQFREMLGVTDFLGLSVAEQKAWADRLYGVLEADPVSFTYQDCDSLRGCLNVLGSEKREAVYPVWVEKTEVWKAADPNELRVVAGALSEQGERGKAGLARIREHVEGVWLGDSKRVRTIAADTWKALAQALAATDAEKAQWAQQLLKVYDADLNTMRSQQFREMLGVTSFLGLSVAEQKAWADRLYGVFEADPASFTYQDCDSLRGCLNVVGSEKQEAVYPVWVEKTEGWKAANPNELRVVASALSEQGERGKAGLARIREHVGDVWLRNAKLIGSMQLADWQRLVQALEPGEPERRAWADKVFAVLVANRRAYGLSDYEKFESVLAFLDPGRRHSVFVDWVENTDAWKKLSASDLGVVCQQLAAAGEAGKAATGRLIEHFEKTYLADNAAALSVGCSEWSVVVVNGLADRLSPKQQQAWIDRLRSAYTTDINVFRGLHASDVVALSRTLAALGDPKAKALLLEWMQARQVQKK